MKFKINVTTEWLIYVTDTIQTILEGGTINEFELADICNDLHDLAESGLPALLTAYRLKRCYDGLNGRKWDAQVHQIAEDEIAKLEGNLICVDEIGIPADWQSHPGKTEAYP